MKFSLTLEVSVECKQLENNYTTAYQIDAQLLQQNGLQGLSNIYLAVGVTRTCTRFLSRTITPFSLPKLPKTPQYTFLYRNDCQYVLQYTLQADSSSVHCKQIISFYCTVTSCSEHCVLRKEKFKAQKALQKQYTQYFCPPVMISPGIWDDLELPVNVLSVIRNIVRIICLLFQRCEAFPAHTYTISIYKSDEANQDSKKSNISNNHSSTVHAGHTNGDQLLAILLE